MTAGKKGGHKTWRRCPPSILTRQQVAFILGPEGQGAACSEKGPDQGLWGLREAPRSG